MHFTSPTAFFFISAVASTVSAHVRLGTQIPGFGRLQNFDPFLNRAPLNTFEAGDSNPDPSKVAFCKGFQAGGGAPTSLNPGPNTFDLDPDQAPHGGGSMQVSLSFDNGKTFKVIKSFIGGVPRNGGGNTIDPNQTYNFTIPADTKSGPAILSWSWSNLLGNREWYNDCAPVTITGTGTNALEDRPDMFVSNIPSLGPCTNAENVNVEYPNPGPDVERNGESGPPNCPPASGTPAPAAPASPSPAASPPVTGGSSVTVQTGDTCSTIASANGVTAAQIMTNNPSINADCSNLQVGQAITLRRRSRIMV